MLLCLHFVSEAWDWRLLSSLEGNYHDHWEVHVAADGERDRLYCYECYEGEYLAGGEVDLYNICEMYMHEFYTIDINYPMSL